MSSAMMIEPRRSWPALQVGGLPPFYDEGLWSQDSVHYVKRKDDEWLLFKIRVGEPS